MKENNFDYGKLGFKAGLEIHQQLDTSKLFCRCPSVLRQDEPDYEINRKLHVVAGESGEIDVAALYQKQLNKEFVYQGYDTTCLIELDEEPPREINPEALEIALHISLLLNCKIIPITQIMRKTVIDGSNTSGFQRTVLIAEGGFIKTSKGKVGINAVYLEEDAARIVKRGDKKDIYRLDRLGIPLVEIVTAPDLKNPEHAKEVAFQIGNILRSCKVRRGIGTIRQDVNLSIRGENRVEIKGMQDMKIFLNVIENEIERQKNLSDGKKPTKMEVRNAMSDGSTKFMRPLPGSARMYPETDLDLLRISRSKINSAKENLPRLREDIENELKKKGLHEEMIKLLLKEDKIQEFKDMLLIVDNPQLIVKILLMIPKEIASKKNLSDEEINEILNEDVLFFVLESLKERKISEADVKLVLERVANGKNVEDAIKIEKFDVFEIEGKILKIIKEKPGLSEKAYMGLVMKEFKGKINGKEVMEIILKHVK